MAATNLNALRAAFKKHTVQRALKRVTSAGKEAREAADYDLERRQAAGTILQPNEVSGEYDAGRLLITSRRGRLTPITREDIRAFQQNVQQLKKRSKYKGGITAQGVIDLGLKADIDRAHTEINIAVVANYKGPVWHFITNSGPDSTVARHHVHVEFLTFQEQVASPVADPKKIGKAVAKGSLKFNCDCGRHTFWYRYIATIGHYNYGRAETGFPKIRNPKLQGVSCKHVLRTMQVLLKDGGVHTKIGAEVIKARTVLDQKQLKVSRTTAAELREHADKQLNKSRSTTILRTTAQKAAESAKRKAKVDMAKKAASKVPANTTPEQRIKLQRKAMSGLQAALSLGAINQAQYDAAIAALGNQK